MLRWMLIYLFSCLLSISYAQPVFEWATKTEQAETFHRVWDMAVHGNSVMTTGHYRTGIDFDPGPGVYPLSGTGMFAVKWDTTGYLEWPIKVAGSSDHSKAIAIDSNNNFYITGYYDGNQDFDPGPGNAYMSATTHADAFVAKYGSFGNYIWSFGINTISPAEDIALDGMGNAYVIGSFQNIGDFDPGLDSAILTSAGSDDIFIAKYNSNGAFGWVRQIGGPGQDRARTITFSTDGHLYVSGSFQDTAYVNPWLPTDTVVSYGVYNTLISKLDTAGNVVWIKSFECTNRHYAYGLVTDNSGNLYVAGAYRDTVDLNPGQGSDKYTSLGAYNIFFAKYSSTGHYIWGISLGSQASDDATSLAIDKEGNIYITGQHGDSTDFDPGPASFYLTGVHTYLSKFDPSGNLVWAIPSQTWDIQEVETANEGSIYITGRINDTVDFDPGPDTFLLIGGGNYDLFTAKYRSRTITDTVAVSICKGAGYTLGFRTYTETGTYYRTYPVRPGLDSMVVVELTVEVPDTTVTRPDHKTLQATNAQATYQWVDCDNGHAPIPGATAQAFTPAVNGHYAVIVTEAGCTDTSGCYAVTSIGVEAGATAVPLTVYPNPAGEQVHLSFYLPEAMDATVRLYDFQGRAVFTKDLGHAAGHQAVTVPVGHLPAGMYHVLLRTEQGSVVRKVVVQR